MECSFTLDSKTDYVEFRLRVYDGELYHRCDIRYDNTNDKIMYLDSTPAWQTLVENIALSMSSRLFHTVKFTVNLDDYQYTRVVMNNLEWASLELDYYTVDSEIAPYIMVQYGVWATDGTQPEARDLLICPSHSAKLQRLLLGWYCSLVLAVNCWNPIHTLCTARFHPPL